MGRIGFAARKGLGLVRWVTLAAGLAVLVAVIGSSGLGSSLASTASATPASPTPAQAVRSPLAVGPAPSAAPSEAPPTVEPPAGDIATALASRDSWASYSSINYRFRIKYPTDWHPSEDQIQGWTVISGWDDSNVSVTWRPIPTGTTLSDITDEVWKAMHENGFTVIANDPGAIAGLPARILTVDGTTSLGHPRHGVIGIVVTATGRYRVELWSRPGSEVNDVKLFNAFLWTFEMV
jgi:hypothetical protein